MKTLLKLALVLFVCLAFGNSNFVHAQKIGYVD